MKEPHITTLTKQEAIEVSHVIKKTKYKLTLLLPDGQEIDAENIRVRIEDDYRLGQRHNRIIDLVGFHDIAEWLLWGFRI